MTTQEIAEKLTGIEYPVRIPQEIITAAKNSGIVIVYGGSDDLMEFEGAISDEVGAPGVVRIDFKGVVPDFEQIDKDDKDALRDYFQREKNGMEIEALWCQDGDYSWSYKTEIPHETFRVIEDGDDPYCIGIVFSLADVV